MNKSWRRFAERLLIAGISFFLLGILRFEQLFTEDWIRVALALYVKMADIKHNMDISRIKNPTQKDFDRIVKYKKALAYLEE